ncbi:MAG: DUF2934 domain-containing protein [Paracoccaceae bacterium]
MAHPNDAVIRERAYEIWLREGCPPDAADRNWKQAHAELSAQADDPQPAEAEAVIVAGPEAHRHEKSPPAPKTPRKKRAPESPVIVAGPEAHANEKS